MLLVALLVAIAASVSAGSFSVLQDLPTDWGLRRSVAVASILLFAFITQRLMF